MLIGFLFTTDSTQIWSFSAVIILDAENVIRLLPRCNLSACIAIIVEGFIIPNTNEYFDACITVLGNFTLNPNYRNIGDS